MGDKIKKSPHIRFKGFTGDWEQRKLGEWGSFYYGHSCPKWSVTDEATTPCIRYGELYTKFGTKIDKVFSYTNMPSNKLRYSKGTEVLIPRVGENPMDYNRCTWLSIPDVAIGEMISVFNTEQNPFFTATMFNATLQKEFASRVEGGSVTNLYYEKLKNIDVLYPSLKEQEKMAVYFENMDNLINFHQRKLELLKVTKKSMVQKMFPKDGESVPEIRFAGFTDAWEQRKLGEMLEERNEQIPENDEYPLMSFVQGAGVAPKGDRYDRSFLVKEDNKKYKKTELGDFIYSSNNLETGSIGFNRTGKAVISPVYSIFSSKSELESRFIGILSTRKDFIAKMLRFRQGVVYGQWRIHERDFLDISIAVPKHEEQKEIINFFANIDNLIALQERELDLLKDLKKSMLQQMFI